MPVKSPLSEILEALHENQLALADAVESVGLWIDQRCGTEVSSTILGAVATIDVNAERVRAKIDELKRLDSGHFE
jgi:predicted regulator of Ras-like GTPase activity (Roadblock/LC7/MglB family)